MKIVGIMPIKLQNERLPGKNTKMLGSKPLLQHALDNLVNTNLCDHIDVFCSSEDIIPFLPKKVNFLKREKNLDLPTSNFNQIFYQENYYYLCDVEDNLMNQNLDEYEQDEEFILKFV